MLFYIEGRKGRPAAPRRGKTIQKTQFFALGIALLFSNTANAGQRRSDWWNTIWSSNDRTTVGGGATSGDLLYLSIDRGFDLAEHGMEDKADDREREARFRAANVGRQVIKDGSSSSGVGGSPSGTAASAPAPTTATPPRPGLLYFSILNKKAETVELLSDGKPSGIGIESGKNAPLELIPQAKIKARYSVLKASGGDIKLEWNEVDLKPDPTTPGPVTTVLPDGRTVQVYNFVVE